MSDVASAPRANRKLVWTGRVISGLVAAMFAMSGVMKLLGGPQLEERMEHLGLPARMVVPLAVIELTCTGIYLIPPTSAVGAILLTGYLGGAIRSHWHAGDPVIVPILLGIAVWIGVCLRQPRLWTLVRPSQPE